MSAISTFPTSDPDDKEEVVAALKKLPSCGKDGFKQLEGIWKVEWMSNVGRPKSNMMLSAATFKPLPPKLVQVTGIYNRVAGSDYQKIVTFTTAGADGVEAAAVVAGKWGEGTAEGNWGRGAARVRCGFKYETVCLVPSSVAPDASAEMLKTAGLDGFLEPRSVDAKADYVDLQHISDTMRWDVTESGIGNVFSRVPDEGSLPFSLA